MSAIASPGTVFADMAAVLGVTELVPLAQGGQKFVLRCLRQGSPAAVKAVLLPPGPAVEHAVRRARRETRILTAVGSPRVVRVLSSAAELRFAGSVPYGVAWVEELLDGADLDTRLGPRWDPAHVARLVVHLAEALAAFHRQGIVHRDLSPGNVRQRENGGFTLMDPGSARFLDEDGPDDAHAVGTEGYRSPEHVAGGVVSPASDVYGLGILAYHALTGHLEGSGFPAVRSQRPDVPEVLGRVVDRCLRPLPGDRFADGQALLDELGTHDDVFGAYFFGAELASSEASSASADPPTAVFEGDRRPALTYAGPETGPVVIRGAFGERRVTVDSIAADQQPFAVRLRPCESVVAPGIAFAARTIELGDGRFTNSYSLTVDVGAVEVGVHSDPDGFFLPDLVADGAVAAISGSFSFISDQPDYQPAEPCLDFCARDGAAVSLPTAAKPAFLVHRGGPILRELSARGTVRIGASRFGWIGSKVPPESWRPGDDAGFVVFGAANCRVQYSPAPQTGFLRWVDRSATTTPRSGDTCVDVVVGRRGHGSGHVVLAVREGGGSDLFEGSYVLRGPRSLSAAIRVGDEVEVCSVDGLDCADIQSGFSIGPSLAAARDRGLDLPAYDESLGYSPFLPGLRTARTLIALSEDGRLHLRVLDGAPLSRSFQGVSCAEAARILEADGIDPAAAYHLDGGQSSKVAFARHGATTVLGSMHYLLWPKHPGEAFQWRGFEGRRLRSALRIGAG